MNKIPITLYGSASLTTFGYQIGHHTDFMCPLCSFVDSNYSFENKFQIDISMILNLVAEQLDLHACVMADYLFFPPVMADYFFLSVKRCQRGSLSKSENIVNNEASSLYGVYIGSVK